MGNIIQPPPHIRYVIADKLQLPYQRILWGHYSPRGTIFTSKYYVQGGHYSLVKNVQGDNFFGGGGQHSQLRRHPDMVPQSYQITGDFD